MVCRDIIADRERGRGESDERGSCYDAKRKKIVEIIDIEAEDNEMNEMVVKESEVPLSENHVGKSKSETIRNFTNTLKIWEKIVLENDDQVFEVGVGREMAKQRDKITQDIEEMITKLADQHCSVKMKMRHTIMLKVLCSLIITTSIVSHTTSSPEDFWPKVTYYVVNDIPEAVDVHCASGDDDIGYHNLQPNQFIHWSFRENFWGTTLFFCHFWWGSKDRAFDVYPVPDDIAESQKYITVWVVKKDGFYVGHDQVPPDSLRKIYSWTKF